MRERMGRKHVLIEKTTTIRRRLPDQYTSKKIVLNFKHQTDTGVAFSQRYRSWILQQSRHKDVGAGIFSRQKAN
jgi:hypothetical protein